MKESHASYDTITKYLNIKTFPNYLFETSGLHYKYVTIINDDSRVINKQSFKLIDDPGVIIYNCQVYNTGHSSDFWNTNGTGVFYYFNDYRGHHRKGIAILTATEVNWHKKLWFHSTKMYFWTLLKGSDKRT